MSLSLSEKASKSKSSLHDSNSSSNDDNDDQDQDQDVSPSLRFSTREQQEIAAALAAQSFHLPGNTSYWQDLRQYCLNNHPVLGICCHHRWHPARRGARVLCLVTSIVFGLVLTNIVWLWAQHHEKQTNSLSFSVYVGETVGQGVQGKNNTAAAAYTQSLVDVDDQNRVQVTGDMIFLWTVGGALHGWFDNVIWTCTVCTCCNNFARLDQYQKYGTGIVTLILLLVTAIATLTLVMRMAVENGNDVDPNALELQDMQSAGLFDDAIDLSSLTSSTNRAQYKEFVLSVAVELVLALVVHYPIVAFVLFSGILNIGGRFPWLGGRPEELRREKEAQAGDNEDLEKQDTDSTTEELPGMTASGEKSSSPSDDKDSKQAAVETVSSS